MKKLNYYQVHKNKKPKRNLLKRRRKPNLLVFQMAVLQAHSYAQTQIIASQPFQSLGEKALMVAKNIVATADAMANVAKNYKKKDYLNRLNKKSIN